jgi:hypothetical protein
MQRLNLRSSPEAGSGCRSSVAREKGTEPQGTITIAAVSAGSVSATPLAQPVTRQQPGWQAESLGYHLQQGAMVERMRGGRDDGHVSPQLLLLLHPPLRLIMQPFSLQIALVAKCLTYELMKKVRLLSGDWPVDHCAVRTIGGLYMPLALSCTRFTHVATSMKLRQLR